MPRAALHARSRARRSATASIVLLGAAVIAAPFGMLGVSGGVLLAVLTAVAVVATATSGGPALAPTRPTDPPAHPARSDRSGSRLPSRVHPPLVDRPSQPRPVAPGPPAHELVFELVYVDESEQGFALDGSVAADLGPELPAGTLFHLRLDLPPSGALRAMTGSVLRAWVEQGSLVAIRFCQKAGRVKAHLASDGTLIVLDVDDASVA